MRVGSAAPLLVSVLLAPDLVAARPAPTPSPLRGEYLPRLDFH